MKRVVSSLLVVLMVLSSSLVFANSAEQISPHVEVIDFSVDENNNVKFGIRFTTGEIQEGDYFDISTPFPVNLQDTGHYTVEYIDNLTWRFIAKDHFSLTEGGITGSRTVINASEVDNIVINGEVMEYKPHIPELNPGDTSGEREAFYKIGVQKGNRILWNVSLRNDSGGTWATPMPITDVIGDGQVLDINSLQFTHYEPGSSGMTIDVKDGVGSWGGHTIFDNLQADSEGFSLDLQYLEYGRTLLIEYYTDITDSGIEFATNEVTVNNNAKEVVEVQVDYSNWSDGNKPSIKLTEFKVSKAWETITKNQQVPIAVQLFKDETEYGDPIILSEQNDWTYTFKELPADSIYSVKEITQLENFEVEYKDLADNHVEIINRELAPELPQVGEKRPWTVFGFGIILLLIGLVLQWKSRHN